MSRSRIQKLLDDGDITVDDKCVKSNYKLNGTEHITITIPELIVPQILPENIINVDIPEPLEEIL